MIAKARGYGRVTSGGITDNFERASLGANWTVPIGNAGIVGSSDLGMLGFVGVHIVLWQGSVLDADQFAEATISTELVAQAQAQVFARRRSSDTARYAFHYNPEGDQQVPPPQWEIKYDGVPTPDVKLLATDSVTAAPVPGDRLRIEVRGSTTVNIRGYHNGRKVIEANDSSAERIASGPPGLVFRAFVGATLTYPAKVFEDFAAGSLIAG
jgi:hypothetical protein